MRRILAVVAVAAASVTVGLSASVSSAAALPAGFSDTAVPNPSTNPLTSPTSITALPGGRALILEKGGAVRVLQADGTLWSSDALSLPVCSGSEMGLLGAAVDPGFILNGFVYLYYTRNAGNCSGATGRFNRVSRFTMSANTIIPASETVLLDNIAATGGNHDGGDLEVGQDGYLYVSIGDAGTNPRGLAGTAARDLSLLNGKIVRITTTGGVPADNPFVADPNAASCASAGTSVPTTKKCTEIFSYGLRNPYRFAFDPNTGATRFFINDVGQNTWEEVDEGGKGLDYGWNSREGACNTGSETNCPPTPAGFTDPLTSYPHSSGCTYITAGAFVPNGVWPAQYDNSYLFADGGCGKVWQRTGAGTVDYANPFAQTSGVIADMAFVVQGADPALYYVTNSGSQLRKITYDAPAANNSSTLAYSPSPASTRPYDTRDNTGVPAGRIRGATTRYVDLGITDPSVKAVLVNLTMVQPEGQGFVVASPGRSEHPTTSNINAGLGEFVANASIVPVDAAGNILVYTSVTTDLVIDVMGTFKEVAPSAGGGRFRSLSPQRLIDTRLPANSTGNNYSRPASSLATSAVSDVVVPVAGLLGVPSGTTAVAFIVTGVSKPGSVAGFVTAFPAGAIQPPTSNLNVNGDGDVRPNLVIVPLGADGSIALYLASVDDVVVDVAGYFTNTISPTGLYHVVAPSRQVDTRQSIGFGALAIGSTSTLAPAGSVPGTATAISQNATMTQTLGAGYLSAYPSDEPRPLASNANVSGPNQDRASLSLTKVGGTGSIAYYSSGGTDLVVDITGYFD